MTPPTDNNTIAIYQSDTGAISLRADSTSDTIWATQKQMAELFDVELPTINEHIKSIFSCNELSQEAAIRKFRIAQTDS